MPSAPTPAPAAAKPRKAPAPAPAPAAAAPVPAPGPAPDEAKLAWTDFWGNVSKSVWSVIVWALFLGVVLGPLLTVLLFSLTPSVFEGIRPTTLQWYRAIVSDPVLY